MQPLTGAPRQDLTDDQVYKLLVGDSLQVAAGLELLDLQNRVVNDISDDLAEGGTIDHDGRATVHGSCRLSVARALAWGRDRVRPYMVLSNDTVSARFNCGVYVLTTPQTRRGHDLTVYDVQGYDLLQLLDHPIGDTYVVTAATTYLAAISDLITDSGAGAPVLLDGTAVTTALPYTMVWALTDSSPATWLLVANDLLAAINYRELWVDENGTYRSEPYTDPAVLAVEWTFDVDDPRTNLVGEDRTADEDLWDAPNWWRFVRRGMDVTPVEGDGIYTVINQSNGLSSADQLGRQVRREVTYLDAADQAALVAQGDRVVAEDTAVLSTRTLVVDPLPIVGHLDVVRYVDGVDDVKAVVVSSSLNLDGTPGQFVLEVVGR